MTKADLIAALAHLPSNARIFIVPAPSSEPQMDLMRDDLRDTAYHAAVATSALAIDTGTQLIGTYLALRPTLRELE